MLKCIRNEITLLNTTEKDEEFYIKLKNNEKKMSKVKDAFGHVLKRVDVAPETYGIIKYALIKISQFIDYMQKYRDTIKPMQNEIQDIKPTNKEQRKHKRDI